LNAVFEWVVDETDLHSCTCKSNSMSQNRLNAVAVGHVHQHHLDDLDLDLQKVAAEFVSRSEIRRRIFGKFE